MGQDALTQDSSIRDLNHVSLSIGYFALDFDKFYRGLIKEWIGREDGEEVSCLSTGAGNSFGGGGRKGVYQQLA